MSRFRYGTFTNAGRGGGGIEPRTGIFRGARIVGITFCEVLIPFSLAQVHLKSIMQTVGRGLVSPADMETLDMAVAVIANENVELATAFIQKKAVEKAGLEKTRV